MIENLWFIGLNISYFYPLVGQIYKTEQSNVMHNIKFYVIGLLFFGCIQSGFSQEDRKVVLAFKVAPTFSWLEATNKGYEPNGSSMGIIYGLLADFRLFGVDNYALSSGFTMNHISGKLNEPAFYTATNGTASPAKSESKYKMTYIDVPLTIRLKTNEIGYNTFYGEFGSELGFNINAKKEYTTTYSAGSTGELTDDVSSEVNLFRSSLVFGLGVQRHISGNAFYRIGLTYHNGLINIFDRKAYLVDSNNNTVMDGNAPVLDKDLSTKLKFIELHLAILF
ncbi:MAG: hypothetical protein ACI9GM_000321 [Salibacteraceae bacterium]|jgi:hypothetical protein